MKKQIEYVKRAGDNYRVAVSWVGAEIIFHPAGGGRYTATSGPSTGNICTVRAEWLESPAFFEDEIISAISAIR